jgi:putative ABC transport system ATP-binding protein
MLGIIASYAIAIGLFMLGVPISVQKLVSTFSFAVEPRMIFTLALMVAGALTGVADFRILQARAVETAPATHLHQNCDRLHPNTVAPPRRIVSPPTCEPVSEANLLTRVRVAMVADFFNVAVVGHFRVQRSELYVLHRSANHP